MKDYYNILGIEPDASAEEIKTAYRRLVMKFHPDSTEFGRDFAEAEMKIIHEAYKTLSDCDARLRYDSILHGSDNTYSRNTTQNSGSCSRHQPQSEQSTYEQSQGSTSTSTKATEKLGKNIGFKVFAVLLVLLAMTTFVLDYVKPVNYRNTQQHITQNKRRSTKNRKRNVRKKRKGSSRKYAQNRKQSSINKPVSTGQTQESTLHQQTPTVQPETTNEYEAARLRREENLRRIKEAQ